MKKLLILLNVLIITPGLAFAAGFSLDGRVEVFESGTRQYMQANMSVRHNTTIGGSPYVLANGYANSSVTFAGRDADNEYFSCYVPVSSTLHTAAVEVKNNMTNGGRLYIYKQKTSSVCENFSLGNYSHYLD